MSAYTLKQPVPARGNPVIYWLLVLMGVSAFAPCILLPEWRNFQSARLSEDREKLKVGEMEAVVDRQRQLLEGLQSDPAVITRIAQRDLHFHHPGDGAVFVSGPNVDSQHVDPLSVEGTDDDAADDQMLGRYAGTMAFDDAAVSIGDGSFESVERPRRIDPPKFLQPYLARLPAYNYDAIFCDPQSRPMVMGLSVALIAAAVLIFSRRKMVS